MDAKTLMIDAGMVLFKTNKPFGTVLGGIKVEMRKIGTVITPESPQAAEVPATLGDFDLLIDYSTMLRSRLISCKLEDAGPAGRTEDGEEIRRYAATFKEGHRNTSLRIGLAVITAMTICWAFCQIPLPRGLVLAVGIILGAAAGFMILRPSKQAEETVNRLMDIVREAR